MMAHRDINNDDEGKKRRSTPFVETPNSALRHFFFPENSVANDDNLGKDFDKSDISKCTAVNFVEEARDGYLDNNGNIIWENNRLENRMAAKFSNKPCLECNIFPICHGGCSSKPLEKGDNYCIFSFDENKKRNAVIERIIYNLKFKWGKIP